MREIVFSDTLDIAGEHLSVHLASDRQIYLRLDDLCQFVGLDRAYRMVESIRDKSIADLVCFMHLPADESQEFAGRRVAFLNLAGLPYWLGLVRSDAVGRPESFDRLVRYTFEFLDTTWMLYRAAADDLMGVESRRLGPARMSGADHIRRSGPRG